MRFSIYFLFLVSLWLFGLSSCRQNRFEPNANIELRFETDSVLFDTVFTTVGSITKRFKVYNPTNRNIFIDEVFLGGRRLSGNSAYRLNINGIASNDVQQVELLANDSLYVFVEVTIDPNNANTPFIVSDSVVFRSGSREGKVYLEAFGQNAIFYNSQVLPCNLVWTADKPIVVYNSVLVDSLCKLTIEAGTRIFFNKNSSLFVLGTLEVNGTEINPVIFRGDRLDPFYRDLAGAWNGIHFLTGSVNNVVRNAEMYNGNVGVRADSLPVSGMAPNVVLDKVIIDNFAIVGLLGFTARITADNTLVSNCGLYNFLGDFGGEYRFRHCTFANFSTGFSRSFPLFALSNRPNPNNVFTPIQLELRNSIVWGSRQEEFVLDTAVNGGFDAQLSHSILRTQRNPAPGANLIFENPRFIEAADKDFRIDTLSPAFNAGQNLVPLFPQLASDLFGQMRSITPTLGAIERIE